MKRVRTFCLVLGALCVTCVTSPVGAADPVPLARAAVAPNAAGIYWQAFNAMPTLKDEQKKVLDAAVGSLNSPLNDDLKPIVAQFRVSLHEMHRATAVSACDWQLDVAAGPELLLPHLQKARELSRVALLRARQQFAAGDNDAALSDVLAVFRMGRDCGVSPILISYLVNVAIEKTAIDVLAAHLPLLKPQQLEHVAKSLRELPATTNASEAILYEERLFGDWLSRKVEAEAAKLNDPQAGGKLLKAVGLMAGLEGDFNPKPDDTEGKRKTELLLSLSVADVRSALKVMRADYATLGKLAALPADERKTRLKEFEESLNAVRNPKTREDALRYFSVSLLPAVGQVLTREEQAATRWQLLLQALRVQRDGAEALQPIGKTKVEYQKTATGFELRCPTTNGVETLTIGRPS